MADINLMNRINQDASYQVSGAARTGTDRIGAARTETDQSGAARTGTDRIGTGRTGQSGGLREPQNPGSLSVSEDGSNKECQTCKNRKYKDGSDEMVSYKTPSHIAPEAAGAAVRAHEQEHVSNAYSKAAVNNGKVISASVSIHLAVCPECGRSYVSGGTTRTQIKYYNENNPYQQDLKNTDHMKYAGMNLNFAI